MSSTYPDVAIGIDLGTTYSCVAYWVNDNVEIIANDQGNRTTPSVVAFSETERLIGESAKNQAAMNPANTIFDAKRLIGRKFTDPTVQKDAKNWPFKIVSKGDKPMMQVDYLGQTKDFSAEEISAMVLTEMKKIAETRLGHPIRKAVVTVPAYFNDAQRQSTKDAGVIAGLEVIRIINEPTAAAMGYGFGEDMESDKDKTILVFDLGGGTFDISTLVIEKGVFEVVATGGDTHLGGEDFDALLVEHFKEEFKKKSGIDINSNPRALRRLRTSCERAKRSLSSSTDTTVEIDSLAEGHDFSSTLSRAKFEDLCLPLFTKCIETVENVLKDAKMSKSQIDEVVLVGGSTRIPKVKNMLTSFFNNKKLCEKLNPDEAVAYGAALQAAILTGQKSKKLNEMLVIDVAPLSLGIETAGGVMAKIIERNTAIPCQKSQIFSTYENNQPAVDIVIFEGERPLTRDCNRLGNFQLSGLSPAPRGTPQIEVTLDLDSNGILTVSAVDKATGGSKNIKITNDKGRLSAAEIDRMVADAEKYKDQDELVRKQKEAYNKLESFLYQSKNSVTDSLKDKLNEKDQNTILDSCKSTEEWLRDHLDESAEVYEAKQKEVQDTVYAIMSKIHPNSDASGFDSRIPQSNNNGPTIDEID